MDDRLATTTNRDQQCAYRYGNELKQDTTTRRLLTIVNPRGGSRRGAKVLASVLPVFERAGVDLDVHETKSGGMQQKFPVTFHPRCLTESAWSVEMGLSTKSFRD